MGTNKQILFLNTFAIILVCIVHSFTAVESYYGHKWIYSFHMPLFMFISGYLLQYTHIRKGKEIANIKLGGKDGYVLRRAKRLLLPYFVISSITFIPKVLLSSHALRPINFSLDSYVHMLIYPWDNVIKFFWFLPTLFIVSVLTVLFYKMGKYWNVKIPILIWVVVLIILYEYNPVKEIQIFNIGGVVSYLVFFITGCMYCKYEEKINKKLRLSHTSITISVLIGYTLVIYCIKWSTPFIGILYAFLGILFSFSLSFVYLKCHRRFLNHLYNSSYAIYLFSWYPLVMVQAYLQKKIELPWIVWAIVSTIMQIYIPFYVYKLILYMKNKYRYGKILALLLGQ